MNKKSVIAALATAFILATVLGGRPLPAAGKTGPFLSRIKLFPSPVAYDIVLEPDFDKGTLSAVCELTVRNNDQEPVAIVPLNLYRLFKVASVTDGVGQPLEFDEAVLSFEDWKELQVDHIRVKLSPPLPPGGVTVLRLVYGGPLLGYTEAMSYVKDHIGRDITMLRSDSLAFPEIGIPSWETNRSLGLRPFTFRISVSVPSSLVAANAGRLVSREEETGGRTKYVYESKVQSWRIDLAVADYRTIDDPAGRFRLFAFPGDADGARALLGRMGEAMALYTKWFGPAPDFSGLTVIEVPAGYGSQADVAGIIQEDKAFKSPDGHYTFYHELSHLWNVTALDPLPSRFESEGLAMFLQHLLQEELEGKAGAAETAVNASLSRLKTLFAEHPDWAEAPMITYGEKGLTDLSYRMGQVLFYLMHETMGEKAFLEAVSGFYARYRATGAASGQFVEYFKARTSPAAPLDRIMEDWVLTARGPRLIKAGTTVSRLLERYRPTKKVPND